MAVALELRISDLLAEFLANALVLFRSFQSAGAVTTGTLQTFLDGLDHFLILIEPNSHGDPSSLFPLYRKTHIRFGYGFGGVRGI